MAFTCSRLIDNEKETMLADLSHDNTDGIQRFWWEMAVGSGEQPIRELVAFIAVEYGLRSYGCKPIESSVT